MVAGQNRGLHFNYHIFISVTDSVVYNLEITVLATQEKVSLPFYILPEDNPKFQKDPLSWILCSTCIKTSHGEITEFISTLEQYFTQYGQWESFQNFITHNGFSSLLSSAHWKLY